MIQRIQSIFLLLGAISLGGLFALPFATSDASMAGLFQDKIYNIFDNPVLLILTILGIVLGLAAIFLFKNRPLQRKLGFGTVTISALLLIASLIFGFLDTESDLTQNINEGFGLGLPVFAIIFTLLANRYIKKDDKLVKSMDRLR